MVRILFLPPKTVITYIVKKDTEHVSDLNKRMVFDQLNLDPKVILGQGILLTPLRAPSSVDSSTSWMVIIFRFSTYMGYFSISWQKEC